MQDTRERLEADITAFMDGRFIGGGLREKVSEWLDRQDAITQVDCIDRWDAKATLRIAELKDQVDELTETNRMLTAEKAGLEDENVALVEAVKRAEEKVDKLKQELAERNGAVCERDGRIDAYERKNKRLHDALKAVCERYGVDTIWSPLWSPEDVVRKVSEGIEQTHMRLPVDADGVPIRLGDMMEGVKKYDTLRNVTGEVIEVAFGATDTEGCVTSIAVQAWSEDGKSWHRAYLDPYATVYRHVKPDTVESLLEELIDNQTSECSHELSDVIAEYAERIRKTVEHG